MNRSALRKAGKSKIETDARKFKKFTHSRSSHVIHRLPFWQTLKLFALESFVLRVAKCEIWGLFCGRVESNWRYTALFVVHILLFCSRIKSSQYITAIIATGYVGMTWNCAMYGWKGRHAVLAMLWWWLPYTAVESLSLPLLPLLPLSLQTILCRLITHVWGLAYK